MLLLRRMKKEREHRRQRKQKMRRPATKTTTTTSTRASTPRRRPKEQDPVLLLLPFRARVGTRGRPRGEGEAPRGLRRGPAAAEQQRLPKSKTSTTTERRRGPGGRRPEQQQRRGRQREHRQALPSSPLPPPFFGAGGAARRGSQGREPLAHADVAGADACEGWRKERKRARSFSVFALALVLWIASSRSLFTFLSFSLFFSASYRHVNDAVKQAPRLRIWLFEACFEEEKRVPSNC